MNTRLLRRIQRAILKHHDQFLMSWWFGNKLDVKNRHCEPLLPGGCGTAACIGGWAIHLSSKRKTLKATSLSLWASSSPKQRLGLDSYQADRLFVVGNWPPEFRGAFGEAKSSKQQAEVAAQRIEHFIETKGEE